MLLFSVCSVFLTGFTVTVIRLTATEDHVWLQMSSSNLWRRWTVSSALAGASSYPLLNHLIIFELVKLLHK